MRISEKLVSMEVLETTSRIASFAFFISEKLVSMEESVCYFIHFYAPIISEKLVSMEVETYTRFALCCMVIISEKLVSMEGYVSQNKNYLMVKFQKN